MIVLLITYLVQNLMHGGTIYITIFNLIIFLVFDVKLVLIFSKLK